MMPTRPPSAATGVPALAHRPSGAQILQARLGGHDLFYLSPLSARAASPGLAAAPARGGVPVLFPQFADTGPLPKHGLVRHALWTLREERAGHGKHWLCYELDLQAGAHPLWAGASRLRLTAQAASDGLTIVLRVSNTGADAFSWTGGLHPYFALPDLLSARVSGLAGLDCSDRYAPQPSRQTEQPLQWNGQPCERLYDGCPALTLDAGSHALLLGASGFDQWMVWNPGASDAAALADLPAGDWRRFVCIEPVRVARPVLLAPGDSFEGHLRIRLLT